MNLISVDPGPTRSGWIRMHGSKPVEWGWDLNRDVLLDLSHRWIPPFTLLIEDVSHMGMAVGKDVFETVRWSGRFDVNETAIFVRRQDVKLTLCGHATAKDKNIRQALIDRYGGDAVAIGGKKCSTCKGKGWVGRGRPPCPDCTPPPRSISCPDSIEGCAVYHIMPVDIGTGYETPPGPLHGMSGHAWSALAVAVAWSEMQGEKK